jgi:hypothetical protein
LSFEVFRKAIVKRKPITHYIDKIYLIVIKCFDKLLVPIENWFVNWYLIKYPGKLRNNIEESIDKGLSYFEGLSSLTFEALVTFNLMVNETFEPRLRNLAQRIHEYRKRWKDPHLRLLDRNYDPEKHGRNCEKEFNVDELSTPEKPILKCLYADKLGLADNYLNQLVNIDDRGGYGTTHVILGGVLLKKFSSIPQAAINQVIKNAVKSIIKAQNYARADDLYSERIVLLQWLGYDRYIKPAWIYRITANQMNEGAWYEFKSLFRAKPNQHASSLALAALIHYRERQLKKRSKRSGLQPVNFGDFDLFLQS